MTSSLQVGDEPARRYTEMLRKLRARPLSSWEFGNRAALLRECLVALAALAAQARGQAPRAVPDIGVHGLADQLAVLIQDATDAGVPADAIDQLVASIAEPLGLSGSATTLR